MYVIDNYSMRPSVFVQARAQGQSPEGELPCKTRGFLVL